MKISDRFKKMFLPKEQGDGVVLGDEMSEQIAEQPAIGTDQIAKAMQILNEYKAGKTNLEARIIENYEWYRMRHWKQLQGGDSNKAASAWLFNSIANKHADAMDNYPEGSVLPREKDDREAASQLSAVVPICFEQAKYKKTYSALWDDKLQGGTGVTGIFWDRTLAGGFGDISIKQIDVLSLYWEPGITDIQESSNLFFVSLENNETLEEIYPVLKGKLGAAGSSGFTQAKYNYDDSVDTSKKSEVVEWYYKKWVGPRCVLHYCKFVSGVVLYATENETKGVLGDDGSVISAPLSERGLYDHGKYPFVFDPLFPVKGTPCGFGFIDIMRDCQLKIDSLGNSIVTNAKMGSKRRFFSKKSSKINVKDYADWSKDFVEVEGSADPRESIMPIEQPQLAPVYLEVYNLLISEIKETSGNRDFSQGGTTAGVTAASAIAALQESGSKLSRDMINQTYANYEEVCYFVIDLMRQFYDTKRYFRILGEGGKEEFMSFDNELIKPQARKDEFGVKMGERVPIFDVKVKAQRQSPFSKISQNELSMELFGKGAFNPALADQAAVMVEMMDFEGKDAVLEKIRNNGLMAQQMEMMKQQMMMLAMLAEKAGAGQGIVASLSEQFGIEPKAIPHGGISASGEVNSLGKPVVGGETLERARERARSAAGAK